MVPFLKSIRTKDERDDLCEHVEELETALFRADSNGLENILRKRFSEELATAMRNMFEHPELKNNPDALKMFFQDIKEILEKLPILKLTLSFRPTEDMIGRLHDWTQKNLRTGVALDISYDGLMLGGARMIFYGKYKEMTLSQMITDVFKKEKTAIKDMIK